MNETGLSLGHALAEIVACREELLEYDMLRFIIADTPGHEEIKNKIRIGIIETKMYSSEWLIEGLEEERTLTEKQSELLKKAEEFVNHYMHK